MAENQSNQLYKRRTAVMVWRSPSSPSTTASWVQILLAFRNFWIQSFVKLMKIIKRGMPSGRLSCLLFQQSEFESRWNLQFIFCKLFENNENEWERGRGLPIKKDIFTLCTFKTDTKGTCLWSWLLQASSYVFVLLPMAWKQSYVDCKCLDLKFMHQLGVIIYRSPNVNLVSLQVVIFTIIHTSLIAWPFSSPSHHIKLHHITPHHTASITPHHIASPHIISPNISSHHIAQFYVPSEQRLVLEQIIQKEQDKN